MPLTRLSVALALAVAAGTALSCAAAEEKPTIRLVVAGVEAGRIDAGIAIDLPAGWKTYWRTPGDAGIPPSIDTTASQGVGTPTVLYPAPDRFDEAGLTAIGYTRSVVLPLDVELADPTRPGRLAMSVAIGLCRDICVPFDVRLDAEVVPGAAEDAGASAVLAAARARVPAAVEKGRPPEIVSVRREPATPRDRVVVEVAMPPEGSERRDLLVEGPDSHWALPQPTRIAAAGGRETWAFDVDGVPNGASIDTAALRFTIEAGDRAVEQVVRIDARP